MLRALRKTAVACCLLAVMPLVMGAWWSLNTNPSYTTVTTTGNGIIGGDLTVTGESHANAYSENTNATGNISGAVSIDWTDGGVQTATASAEITSWAITGGPAGEAWSVTLILDTNGQTIGTSGLTVAGGSFSFTADGEDLLVLFTPDGGTTLYLLPSGQDMSAP